MYIFIVIISILFAVLATDLCIAENACTSATVIAVILAFFLWPLLLLFLAITSTTSVIKHWILTKYD